MTYRILWGLLGAIRGSMMDDWGLLHLIGVPRLLWLGSLGTLGAGQESFPDPLSKSDISL